MDKKNKKKTKLPFRLNILFIGVFLLFSILILQLGVVQILNGDSFQGEIEDTTKDTTKVPVPRGMMYDRNQEPLVENEALYSITYTPQKGDQADDRLKVAKKLAKYIKMDDEDESEEEKIDELTERDFQEYWYLENEDDARELLTEDEKSEMDDDEQYTEILKRIDKDEAEDYSEEERRVIAIKKEMDKASSLTEQVIKNNGVTPDEYARVSEHLGELDGINATTDWDRNYPHDNTLSAFIGRITSKEEGIIKEKEPYYLTRGYSRNDRVGRSGLEEQYEDELKGRKEQVQYTTDKKNDVVDSDTVVEGERGNDLVLTLDVDFQEKVDELVADELKKTIEKYPDENKHMEDAFAVAIDPKTGELLAASGQHYYQKSTDNHDKGDVSDQSLGVLTNATEPGSSIKGATVLTGFEEGVIEPGEVIVDKPLQFADSKPISSIGAPMGPVNDYEALKRSSNVYMANIGMRLLGVNHYEHDMNLPFNKDALIKMRNNFGQFGLGTRTGIDFPQEATGISRETADPSSVLFNSFGQFDTFTTMQLAQYVSTIANDGYRVRPHFLKEVRKPTPNDDDLGPVDKSVQTDVMNRVQMDDKYIDRVQDGFKAVFQESGGTAYDYFKDKDYNPAGKTGTAEKVVGEDEDDVDNLALVGYAPFDDPEIAFAVMVTHTGADADDQRPIHHNIGEGILDTYFDIKEDDDD